MTTFYLEGPGGIPAFKQIPSGASAHTKVPMAFEGGFSVALGGATLQDQGMLALNDVGHAIPGARAGIDTAFSHVLRLFNNFATGNTQIVTPNGTIQMYAGGTETLDVNNGSIAIDSGTALTAGGALMASMSQSNIGIYVGSGAPTVSAPKGSIYLRSDGSSTSTRMYVNTDGATTWTSVTTAA